MEPSLILWLCALAFILLGFAGLFVPAMPGVLLILAGFVCAAWAEGFAYVGWGTLAVLALLTIISYTLDFLAGIIGAQRMGAGRYGIAGAAVGSIIGLAFGMPGILAGPFIGAVIGELYAKKDIRAAGAAGLGTWLGMVAGTAFRIATAMAMAGVFLFSRFFLAH